MRQFSAILHSNLIMPNCAQLFHVSFLYKYTQMTTAVCEIKMPRHSPLNYWRRNVEAAYDINEMMMMSIFKV